MGMHHTRGRGNSSRVVEFSPTRAHSASMLGYVRTCSMEDAQYSFEQAKAMLERARFMWSEASQAVEKTQSLRAELRAQIHELAKRGALRRQFTTNLLSGILEATVESTRADMGNIQLLDPKTGRLHIRVQRGFSDPFLEFFNSIHPGHAACDSALKSRERVVVPDITDSPMFRGTRLVEVMLDAGIRAVQATPLLGKPARIGACSRLTIAP